MSRPEIHITTSEDFQPSDRLRAALEQLGIDLRDEATEHEVEGFAQDLNIGISATLKTEPGQAIFRDGCWGHSACIGKGGKCGWYQYEDESCLGFTW